MDVTDTLRHEFLAEVAEAAQRAALSLGVPPEVAEQIGCAVADMMCYEYAGLRIYIPLDQGYRLAPRDRDILRLLDAGKTAPQLARQYRLSEERIRQIRARRHLRDPDSGRGKLFDEPS
ncbi:MAG: hypothetical protein H7A12_16460 [Pseudomonadales bacterium]|jgi:Mor family transcriptional regulator|nr:hypothetical protein [Pseudomonadales bacterium]